MYSNTKQAQQVHWYSTGKAQQVRYRESIQYVSYICDAKHYNQKKVYSMYEVQMLKKLKIIETFEKKCKHNFLYQFIQ